MTLCEFETALDALALQPPGVRLVETMKLFESLLARFAGLPLGGGSDAISPADVAEFLAPYHAAFLAHPTLMTGVIVHDHDGEMQ